MLHITIHFRANGKYALSDSIENNNHFCRVIGTECI